MRKFWRRFFVFKWKRIKVWWPCNIYPTARIQQDVSIGMFTEIGEHVKIGKGTRIGASCFIPENVEIGENVFIGPKVCFTNDLYPPSNKREWKRTYIGNGAAIGAGSVILPVHIGEGALIGAGSVVTKDVPPYEIWAGIPAKRLKGGNERAWN